MIDYIGEIPFEKKLPIGFHDASQDVYDKAAMDFRQLRQQNLDSQRRDDLEAKERKKDKLNAKKRKEDDTPDAIFRKDQPDKKRSKLVLPAPQISDRELEDVSCFL